MALGTDIAIIIQCFAVVVIGGFGSILGTFVASLAGRHRLLVLDPDMAGWRPRCNIPDCRRGADLASVGPVRHRAQDLRGGGADDGKGRQGRSRLAHRTRDRRWAVSTRGDPAADRISPRSLLPGRFWTIVATEILILGLFAMSFNLLHGYMGQISFGHAAFFGLGAYATGLLMRYFKGTIPPTSAISSSLPRCSPGPQLPALGALVDRILLRSPDRHLFRHPDARLRRAALLYRVLLVQLHQRRRRRPRTAAAGVLSELYQLLLFHLADRRSGDRSDVAHRRLAVWLFPAYDPRQSTSHGVSRHQRARQYAGELRDRRRFRRGRRSAVGTGPAKHRAGPAGMGAIGDRSLHGADRRRQIHNRADHRLDRLYLPARLGDDLYRVLATDDRIDHSGHRIFAPGGLSGLVKERLAASTKGRTSAGQSAADAELGSAP